MPPLYRWDSVSRPRGGVQILHGMAEHAGRYARFASALNLAGYVAWGHDHRGHGKNAAEDGLGHFGDRDGWRLLIDDAEQVGRQMRAAYPVLPLFLFAHSMGSFVAQALIAEHGCAYRGVILCGSDGPGGVMETGGRMLAGFLRLASDGRKPGTALDSMAFTPYNRQFAPNRTRVDWLSRDAAEVDRYVADELCGFPLTIRSWFDFLNGKKVLGTKQHISRIPRSLPIYIIGGTRDPVGDNAKGLERLAALYRAAGLMVDSRFYEGARHELLNETNRDEVTRDILAWLDAHL
jgi:alpha-beta hydrolase superfamily lysophospholipase